MSATVTLEESPDTTVVSGTVEETDRFVAGCERRKISCQRVRVEYTAHSPLFDPVREPLLDSLAGLEPAAGTVPFLSTVTGEVTPGTALDADYWWRNLREPVRLDHTVRAQQAAGPVVFLAGGAAPGVVHSDRRERRGGRSRRPGPGIPAPGPT
ncbi:acyltransferase domain-containing protein [Streptomyces spectabilis]|uniref:Acyl transferase domain-containing protein n=1 Tax=Streptomyces spectabilis TaxID=68270 RepID=A0A7W8B6D4_STRST|nr:acyltransferase domain-containing protein [Streptomyces spectabilis]MBB5109672.1 acyl transferase domain-containing protein [Streptomyces spectabilis]GGV55110.1 hypothetical protein GCM10010245_87190 [Streptomyces spectabilis]